MRIVVEELSVKGFEFSFSQGDAWAAGALSAASGGSAKSIKGSMRFERAKIGVTVDVKLDASFTHPCDRCGVETVTTVTADEQMLFWPEGYDPEPGQAGVERELDEDDLDVGWYADGVVLTEDVLSEVVVLNTPNRIVCEDEASCRASMKSDGQAEASQGGHPAFAALKARLRT